MDEFIWSQKYRPKNINECILPEELKKTFLEISKKERLPNMTFTGTCGIGKTTVALALCQTIGCDTLFINGSEESGIEILRTKIKSFASTISLTGAKKVVIIDEAEGMNANSSQMALRGLIEEFSNNCSFILTCNFKGRILDAIISRCPLIEFKIETKDKIDITKKMFLRSCEILNKENIEFDKKVVLELVTKYFPDFRRVIGELQKYSVSGRIDSGILINTSDESYKELFGYIKVKNFTEVRKWIGKNSDIDSTYLYRQLYDKGSEIIVNESLPQMILILADYGYKAVFVADKEVNNMACLTEIMGSCEFK